MKFKTLLMAFVLSISSIAAFATPTVTTPVSVTTPSFSDLLVATITLTGTSDITGTIEYLNTAFSVSGFTFSFVPVSITNNTFGSTTAVAGNAFSFTNVSAGLYNIFASGSLGSPTPGTISLGYGSVFASYTATPSAVTAVPEPRTSGMFLAGLGIIGFIASRRKSLI